MVTFAAIRLSGPQFKPRPEQKFGCGIPVDSKDALQLRVAADGAHLASVVEVGDKQKSLYLRRSNGGAEYANQMHS